MKSRDHSPGFPRRRRRLRTLVSMAIGLALTLSFAFARGVSFGVQFLNAD